LLPILLSIPHGGTKVPEELRERICITPKDLFDDSDAFTTDIYDLGGDVAAVVKADIARAFVDLNRAPEDRPPRNPDGVVKASTCFKRPIYAFGQEPDTALTEQLIDDYHAPYHAQLARAVTQPGIELALDCHSMLPAAPPISSDPGAARPLFCVSNRDGATAPSELLERLAASIAEAFEVRSDQIGLNDPFKGGYITQTHGAGELPWIQVEMNRSLYLGEPWFDHATRDIDPARISELRERFMAALRRLKL